MFVWVCVVSCGRLDQVSVPLPEQDLGCQCPNRSAAPNARQDGCKHGNVCPEMNPGSDALKKSKRRKSACCFISYDAVLSVRYLQHFGGKG